MILIINDNESVLCMDEVFRKRLDFKSSRTGAKVYVRISDAKKKALAHLGKVADIPDEFSIKANGDVIEYKEEKAESEDSQMIHKLSDFVVYNSKMPTGRTLKYIEKVKKVVKEISELNRVQTMEKIESLHELEKFFEQEKMDWLTEERRKLLQNKMSRSRR